MQIQNTSILESGFYTEWQKKVPGQLPVAEIEDLRSSPTQKVLSQSDPLDRQGSI